MLVTRQYWFCLTRTMTPFVRNVAHTLPPPARLAPNIAPSLAATRGDHRAGERRLLVPVCGRCRRRRCDEAFIFCPPGRHGRACQPICKGGGWSGRRRPPSTHPTGFATETTYVLCAEGSTRGAQQRSRTLGRPPLRLVAVPGGEEEEEELLLMLQWCCDCAAGHFFRRGPSGAHFVSFWRVFCGCRRAPRGARVASSGPPLGALPALFM